MCFKAKKQQPHIALGLLLHNLNLSVALGLDFIEFVHERIDVFEFTVNGSKANIGDFVDALELLHRELADIDGSHLAVERILEHSLNLADCLFELFHIDRALFARFEHAVEKLVSVKNLARLVLFDDDYRHGLDYLIGRKTLAAADTFAAAAYSLALVGRTRVDDLALFKTTERTLQSYHSILLIFLDFQAAQKPEEVIAVKNIFRYKAAHNIAHSEHYQYY